MKISIDIEALTRAIDLNKLDQFLEATDLHPVKLVQNLETRIRQRENALQLLENRVGRIPEDELQPAKDFLTTQIGELSRLQRTVVTQYPIGLEPREEKMSLAKIYRMIREY